MIYIIDDDHIAAECLALACRPYQTRIFPDAISAISALNTELPDLIFLDILLDGPDGFTFLNEIVSYPDSTRIPIVLVSSLDFSQKDLTDYGVVGILNKATMKPQDIQRYVREYIDASN